MIPVIYRKSDYLDTLKYVMGKEGAQVIDSNMASGGTNDYAKQFLKNRLIKPDLKNPCTHLILSISSNGENHEHLNNLQWGNVTKRCLQELGYLPNSNDNSRAPSQYVAVRHHDREHEHLHIITSQIRLDGSRVSDSFERFKAQTATRLIAHEMGLQVTPTSCEAVSKKLMQEYGIVAPVSDNRSKSIRQVKRKSTAPSTKDIIKESLELAINSSRSTKEFIDKLEEREVYPIARLDKNQQILGFAYTHKGVTIAGSQINRKLSWTKLKDTLQFNIEPNDVQLLLDAKYKGEANISKYKPNNTGANSDDSGSNNDEQSENININTSTTNTYISVLPSVQEIFQTGDKNRKKQVQTTDDKQNSNTSTSDNIEAPQSNNQSNVHVVSPQENNTNTYISVLPSIQEIWNTPQNINIDHDNDTRQEIIESDQLANNDNQYQDDSITGHVEDVPNTDSTLSTNEILVSNVVKSTPNTNQSADNQSIQQCISIILKYMGHNDSNIIDGDTLYAFLDGTDLTIIDKQSSQTLLNANYELVNDAWSIKNSTLTEEHLERIQKIERRLDYGRTSRQYSNNNELD